MGQHHHLYGHQWRKARAVHLSAHPLCRMHEQLGQTVAASVVDHIAPHRGDQALFWDRENWQSLCKQCHDAHKQAQEASGLLRGAGLDGRPLDLAHPWHARPTGGAGGGQKSKPAPTLTGRFPPSATPRNGQGGLS